MAVHRHVRGDAADGAGVWRTGVAAAGDALRAVDLPRDCRVDAGVWPVDRQPRRAGDGRPGVFCLDQYLQPVHRLDFLERAGRSLLQRARPAAVRLHRGRWHPGHLHRALAGGNHGHPSGPAGVDRRCGAAAGAGGSLLSGAAGEDASAGGSSPFGRTAPGRQHARRDHSHPAFAVSVGAGGLHAAAHQRCDFVVFRAGTDRHWQLR
ncbi:hypothetical protein D3C72_1553110 [compost metagenome]